jgi:hypothetical protein
MEIVEVNGLEVVLVADRIIEVVEVSQPLEYVELGIQGPPGVPGDAGIPGPAGGAAVQLTAAAALGGNRVVTGASTYADNADVSSAGLAVGVTMGAASVGATVNIIVIGELDGFAGLTVNQPVYIAANGTLSQTPPATGYLQRMGVAVSATKLLINISPPLILG